MEQEVKKVGRPTKYKEEYAEQARKLCLLGHTDKELAQFFEVSSTTIDTWKNEYPEFLGSVTRGKTDCDDSKVQQAMLKRALGFRYQEEIKEPNELGEMVVTKVYEKEHAPDAGACLNWLKNRQPDKWRDNKHLQVEMTHEEWLDSLE